MDGSSDMTNIDIDLSPIYQQKSGYVIRLNPSLIDYYIQETGMQNGKYLYQWHSIASTSPYYKQETDATMTLLEYNALRVIEHKNNSFRYNRAIINLVRHYKQCVDRHNPLAYKTNLTPKPPPKPKPKPQTEPKEWYKAHEIYRTIGISRNRWLYVRKKVNLPNRKRYSQKEYDKVLDWNTQHPPGTPHKNKY